MSTLHARIFQTRSFRECILGELFFPNFYRFPDQLQRSFKILSEETSFSRSDHIIENFFLKPSYTLLDVHGGTKISIDFFSKLKTLPKHKNVV